MVTSLIALVVRYVSPWSEPLQLDTSSYRTGFLRVTQAVTSLGVKALRRCKVFLECSGSVMVLPLHTTLTACFCTLCFSPPFPPHWRVPPLSQNFMGLQDPVQIPPPPQSCVRLLQHACPSQGFHRHLSPEPHALSFNYILFYIANCTCLIFPAGLQLLEGENHVLYFSVLRSTYQSPGHAVVPKTL